MTSRAVVLGGGGVTGIAWELGMLAGLQEAGIDLTQADLFVGTSAGSAVAAMVAGDTDEVKRRYQAQLHAPTETAARMRAGLLAKYVWFAMLSRTSEHFGRRMGALARATKTVAAAQRREVIAERLKLNDWPARPLKLTAVDALTGEFVVFDRESGVPMIDAVAASCAVPGVWPAHEINGRAYIDGGMRSAINADLAAGSDAVVVLAPLVRALRRSSGPRQQVAKLRDSGSRVILVSPDIPALKAIGPNVLDPGRRKAAAEAGFRQASAAALAVAQVWSL